MAKLIISISGMRGIIGENLTPAIAAEYGMAFGSFLRENNKPASVCIGRDSRPSGQMLTAAVSSGLCAVGINVIDLGIVTTPTVGIMVRHLKCGGGIVITASHNPVPYNGVKLLLDNGIAPPKNLAEKIRGMYFDRKFLPVDSVSCGKTQIHDDPDTVHIEKVLSIVEVEKISAKKFSIVLDSVNGAGGRAAVRLLKTLGCEVIEMNTDPTGIFAHTPEPVAENLTDLCEKVRQAGADVGFAQDPDADRLAIVDNNGRFIGEEFTLALAAKLVFSNQKGTAAANLSTSRMIDDIAADAGCSVIRTPVGEANVAEAMLKHQCVIGGEGNGGVIDLRVGPVRDSLAAMGLVLQLMADTDQSVSRLADQIGGYCMVKNKLEADSEIADKVIEKAKEVFPGARIDESDGCRFDFDDGWIHLRTSNTEPIMRSIVETRDKETADKYIGRIEKILKQVIG